MKIVIAPDSFKESLTAAQAAHAIAAGFSAIFPDAELVCLPIADGGEGTVRTLAAPMDATLRTAAVSDPLGRSVVAEYALTAGGTAILEMASACGLHLLTPAERDPLLATSRGLGELVLAALDAGAKHFIIGIGGSATNDCGAGFLQALGVRFLDADGQTLGAGARPLSALARIDTAGIDARLSSVTFDIACDVDNPLSGSTGASVVFGPQKGATPDMVLYLDQTLQHVAEVIRHDVGRTVAQVPGAGAAGGMGAAMLAFLQATLRPGSEIIMEALQFEQVIQDAALVITGEGCIDGQTSRGKAPAGVARIAARHGIPVIALGGAVVAQSSELTAIGIQAAFASVPGACSLETALLNAAINLQNTARNVAVAVRLGMQIKNKA